MNIPNGICALGEKGCFTDGKCYYNGNCENKVVTNADRIRAMSDEELADFLILSPEMEFDVCRYCEYGNHTPMDDRGFCLHPYGSCLANAKAEAFKKWLKQPTKDGEDDAV